MTDYRAFLVRPGGHFRSVEIITAPDDRTAVEAAKHFAKRDAVQVWDLDRKGAVLPVEM